MGLSGQGEERLRVQGRATALRTLFGRRRSTAPFAGLLCDWIACCDVGGLYYRGVLQRDELGRFEDGATMTTGYVLEDAEEGGVLTATDACYRLGTPAKAPADRPTAPPPINVLPPTGLVSVRSFVANEEIVDPSEEEGLLHFRASTHFELLYRSALAATGAAVPDSPRILVVGAGTGSNAVGPCLRMFRGAQVVATDPSVAALARLRGHLRSAGADDRVTTLRAELSDPPPEAAAYDLVAGVSALHRMLDPDQGLANAARALKPGGLAIFMEPFEGYGLMRLAFQRICREAEAGGEPLDERTRTALQALTNDIAARTAPDTGSPAFPEMDEKWLFSRESIAAAAAMLGFAECRFVSHNDHGAFYRDLGLTMLRRQLGDAAAELPAWAVGILDEFDQALPPSVKRLLLMDGTIVLRRGG